MQDELGRASSDPVLPVLRAGQSFFVHNMANQHEVIPHVFSFACAEGGTQRPALAWFDQVLADVGDGQSLQQSLSTFSGHVRRLRGILAAATPHSLVLLDEVISTD